MRATLNSVVEKQDSNGDGLAVRRTSRAKVTKDTVEIRNHLRTPIEVSDRQFITTIRGDARHLNLQANFVDVIISSPPYWRKRDYKLKGQIGQERTPDEYVRAILMVLRQWRKCLRPTGSVFLNIGDTYNRRSLVDIPSKIIAAAHNDGWLIRNRIIWVKSNGVPDPAKNRLANRHEYIIHLTIGSDYYYDLFAYNELYPSGENSTGDVWMINSRRNASEHLAPFPPEIVERVLTLACPREVCVACDLPRRRIVSRTRQLNPERPQARRAMEIAESFGLTDEHITAIQAVGISDAGKAIQVQTGAGKNSEAVKRLASEAKAILGGYFREFTFSRRRSDGWTDCRCEKGFMPGVVLDGFMGSGTTLKVAAGMGRSAIGVDLSPHYCREFMKFTESMFV